MLDVETASDGEVGLAALDAKRPDLLITDMMMPRLDGSGLLRKVRAEPQFHDLPVIMLSARGEEYDKLFGFEIGIDD